MMVNKLAGHTSYLSGGMDRVEWCDATEWRDEIADFLHDRNIGVLNPCDKPSGTQESPNFRGEIQALKNSGQFDLVQDLMKPVCRVDLRMVQRSDFVIAHIDLNIHACGTYWELAFARLNRIPVIIHCKQDKSSIPNWLFGVCDHNEMFGSWKDVENYIADIDDGVVVPNPKHWHFFDNDHIFGVEPS